MARSLNYPARVVMGFAPDIRDGGGDGGGHRRGRDRLGRGRLRGRRLGGVLPDAWRRPTSRRTRTRGPRPSRSRRCGQPPLAEHEDEDLLTPGRARGRPTTTTTVSPFVLPGCERSRWGAYPSSIPTALIFIPLMVIGLIKASRMRKRRSAAKPHDRIAGAWDELTDRFSELGYDAARQAHPHGHLREPRAAGRRRGHRARDSHRRGRVLRAPCCRLGERCSLERGRGRGCRGA